jgi:hypothetical protein
MSLRIATIVISATILAGCTYYPPPPMPVYSYVPCPPSPVPPPPGATAPAPTPPGGASGNQCLAATVPYPPYQYYVPPAYYPYGAPYYPGAGVSFGFGGVIR